MTVNRPTIILCTSKNDAKIINKLSSKSNVSELTIITFRSDLDYILELVFENPSIEITVDLLNQKLLIDEKEFERYFEINSHKKNNLMNGLDDIDYLTNMKDEIINFSKKIPF